jgi:hypothetical protein
MNVPSLAACVSLVALLALPAAAQDSVSKLNALPGDALDSRDPLEQVNDYVVDLAVLRSSYGNVFGVAPLCKASAQRSQAPTFYTGGLSAQAISKDLLTGVPFARASYDLWTQPGRGVHHDAARNDPGQPVDTSALTGNRFAVGFAEFGLGTGDVVALNGLVGAFVDYDPAWPSRLYVSRVVAGVNSADDDCDLGQYGFGAIDADGALHFRGDDSQGQAIDCGGFQALVLDNYLRVDLGLRNPSLVNVLGPAGGSDAAATTPIASAWSTVLNAPNAIPTSVAGRPVLLGSDFAINFVWESAPGSVSTSGAAHLAPGANDHRGNVGFTPIAFPALLGASTVGTAAMLARTPLGPVNVLNVIGVAADGSPTGVLGLQLPNPLSAPGPTVLIDNDDGWRSDVLGPGFVQFDHYHSQVAFRGGSGQVAIGRDRDGRLLVAGTADHPNSGMSPFSENNLIAVGRHDAGTTSWTVAAYTYNDTQNGIVGGKAIHDGAGAAIGRLVPFSVLAGNPFPSISSPMIDALGNVWFLSSIEVFGSPSAVSVGLVRAVLDAASFSYRLELVLKEGDVFRGPNSGTDWVIDHLEVPDSNSISSGTAFSNNISAATHLGQDPTGLAQDDAATLGGLVIQAGIVYDADGDGQFVRSTGANGTPGSPDEDYQVLLYVAASADCNDNGVPDDRDVAEGASPDVDGNGIPDACQAAIAFCFGDGSGTLCPCSNNGAPGSGCGNATNPLGGRLVVVGDPSQGSVLMVASGLPATYRPTALLVSSPAASAPVPFGDGLGCLPMLPISTPVLADFALNGTVQLVVQNAAGPGTLSYQLWYRNRGLFCSPDAFNATNGQQVVWP